MAKLDDVEREKLRTFLIELAQLSAAVIIPYFGNNAVKIENKSNDTPVTVADREAERVMRERITERFPSHGIIGEEFGNYQENAEFVWSLDPIDGTVSFTHACPLFGTLIGLLHNGKPILGAIHQPILEQLVIGDGTRTTLNGRPVSVRSGRDLAQASLFASDIDTIKKARGIDGFDRLRSSTKIFRTWGDCYGYLLLAAGFADIMLDGMMNPWDLIPLIPVVRGAGGAISAWDGGEVLGADSTVAASAELHAQVIEILNL